MTYEAIDYGDAVLFDAAAKIDKLEATLQAKDAQIEALVTALREIRDMTICDALGERFMRAQATARMAIKEATS